MHEDLGKFTDYANALLVISNPHCGPIERQNALFQEDESGARQHVLQAEPGTYSIALNPVTLSATGSSSRPTPRPLAQRVADLLGRSDYFRKASNFLANAGDDLRELYKAIEAIEKAHGGWPKKKNKAGRAAFCAALVVEEEDWEAMHRTALPERHAYPHDMVGPTLTPQQVRMAVQHALKTWLEREVPV